MSSSPRCVSLLIAALALTPTLAWGQEAEDPLAPPAGAASPAEDEAGEPAHAEEGEDEHGWSLFLQARMGLPLAVTEGEAEAEGIELEPGDGISTSEGRSGGLALNTALRAEVFSPWRLGFGIELSYAYLSALGITSLGGRGLATLTTEGSIDRLACDLTLPVRALDLHLTPWLQLELTPVVGLTLARYSVEGEVQLSVIRPGLVQRIEASYDTAELLLGAEVLLGLGKGSPLALVVRGDTGGFGIGSAPELTWRAFAGLRWRPTPPLSVELGYHARSIEYERGEGPTRFEWNAVTHGIYLGINAHF